jgi:hypothetical protein
MTITRVWMHNRISDQEETTTELTPKPFSFRQALNDSPGQYLFLELEVVEKYFI